jgi:hypothetical protein
LTDSRRNNQAQRQQWVDGRPSSYIERKSAAVGGLPNFVEPLVNGEVRRKLSFKRRPLFPNPQENLGLIMQNPPV